MYIICPVAVQMMPRLAPFVFVSIVAAFPPPSEAARGPVSEDVPVRGGSAALARTLAVELPPDRARFVSEIVRLTHLSADDHAASKRRIAGPRGRDRARPEPSAPAPDDSVPIPLNVATWSQAVFHRPIPPDQIVAAIVADAHASFLCHGLTGLDDDTLQFLVDHPGTITRLYERTAAAFATSASSLQDSRQPGCRAGRDGGCRSVDRGGRRVAGQPGGVHSRRSSSRMKGASRISTTRSPIWIRRARRLRSDCGSRIRRPG